VDKKDILDLNKKERRDDEGVTNFNEKRGWYARNCAYFVVLLLQGFSIAAENRDVRVYLSIILMSLLVGDCFGMYKVTNKKGDLVVTIIAALYCLYRLVQLGHSIGMS